VLRRAPILAALCAIGCATPAPPVAVAPEPETALAPAPEPAPDPAREEVTLATAFGASAAEHAAAGRLDEAARDYRHALDLWLDLQPQSDALVAETLANLALIHRARGERDRARALLDRALPLYEKTLAPGDPTLARVRALIAEPVARPAPRAAAAEPNAADTARALDREGAALLDREDYAGARRVLERAVALHEHGDSRPVELGASLSQLGRCYAALGEREAALSALHRSLALIEPELGKLDPLTLATRASLEHVRAQPPAHAR
jgi:tetratricopeptide (TPR) repeat protein